MVCSVFLRTLPSGCWVVDAVQHHAAKIATYKMKPQVVHLFRRSPRLEEEHTCSALLLIHCVLRMGILGKPATDALWVIWRIRYTTDRELVSLFSRVDRLLPNTSAKPVWKRMGGVF